MTFRRLTRQLNGRHISYLKYFTIHPTYNLTTSCAHMMVNLFGQRPVWRPSLTDIYSGVTAFTSHGYNTVSMLSLNDQRTRLISASGVLLEIVCRWGGAGRSMDKQAVVSPIFASFAVYSMYNSILARLRWPGFRFSKACPCTPRKKRSN